MLNRRFYTTTCVAALMASAGAGDITLLAGETNGLAIDFTNTTDFVYGTSSPEVQVRTASVDAFTDAQAFFTNAGTSPKMVRTSSTQIGWSPHNLFLNSGSPATQNVTLVANNVYTYGITGTGSLAGTSGASGTATAGSPVTFTASGTTGTFTVTGSPTTMWINRGETQTQYLATTGSIVIGPPISYGEGLLVEPAATNICGVTQDIAGGGWANRNSTDSTNTDTAPDGTTTADTLTGSGASTFHGMYQQVGTANNVYTQSIYVKAGTCSYASLTSSALTGTTNYATAVFDLTNGSATAASETAVGATSGTITGTKQENIGNGWFRISMTSNLTGIGGSAYRIFGQANAATGNSFTTDGEATGVTTGLTLKLWGVQVETGVQTTSYIPNFNTFSSVTRAIDKVKYLLSLQPSLGTAFTSYLDFVPAVVATNEILMSGNAAGANTEVFDFETALSGSQPGAAARASSSTIFGSAAGANATVGTRGQLTARWKANDFAVTFDGNAIVADTAGALPSGMDQVEFGGRNAMASGPISGPLFVRRFVLTSSGIADGSLPTWRYNF
jgi:hypothetical protein